MAKRATPRKPKLPAGHGHPRPLLQRQSWTSLNGPWDSARSRCQLAHARGGAVEQHDPRPVRARDPGERHRRHRFLPRLLVPPHLRVSGAQGGRAPAPALRRRRLPRDRLGQRRARDRHEGGYTPFTTDLPSCWTPRAADDRRARRRRPADLAKPRGKQDWQLEPHSIWYPRTTGIWQTVWLETVPATRIGRVALDAEPRALGDRLSRPGSTGAPRDGLRLRVQLSRGRRRCSPTTPTRVIAGEVHRRIALVRSRASTTPATSCCGARTRRR